MTHYSRRTYVFDFTDLQPGDLIDISATAYPYWSVVERIGGCEEDEYADASAARAAQFEVVGEAA